MQVTGYQSWLRSGETKLGSRLAGWVKRVCKFSEVDSVGWFLILNQADYVSRFLFTLLAASSWIPSTNKFYPFYCGVAW